MEPVILKGDAAKAAAILGSGSGSGSGYGSSDGYGDGSGDGFGFGFGDGYGYGSSDGYGDGSGDGSGSGSGSGSGDGFGSGSYWLSCIEYFAAKWSEAQRKRLTAAKKAKAKIAIWRSDANGQPANNGGKIEAAAPGVVHTSPGPLNLCNKGTLHATLIPPKWEGERWWVVALHGEVVGDDEKYGCLKREIIGECL